MKKLYRLSNLSDDTSLETNTPSSQTPLYISTLSSHHHAFQQTTSSQIAIVGYIRRNKRRAVDVKEQKVHEFSLWCHLSAELLELILSRLTLRENIRFSAVCKRWHSIAVSARPVNKPPWIMYFPKFGDLYEFYDPLTRKTYSTEIQELCGSRVCYTKAGWLLLYKPRTHRLFFFNPYSRELLKLPRFEITSQIVVFSSEPTSPNCVVFTVKDVSPAIVVISTCHPGATEWRIVNYPNRLPFVSCIWDKLVFSNGRFYCLSLTGWLGVFNPKALTWSVLVIPPPQCPDNFSTKNWGKGKFLAEHDGDILVIYTCCSDYPKIFKLDLTNAVWDEVKTLEDVSLFASFLSSQSRTDLPGIMRNNIYFPKVRFYGKRCISYSLKECRYYPSKQSHDWEEQDPFESIWIDPPQDVSVFM